MCVSFHVLPRRSRYNSNTLTTQDEKKRERRIGAEGVSCHRSLMKAWRGERQLREERVWPTDVPPIRRQSASSVPQVRGQLRSGAAGAVLTGRS